MKRIFDLTDKVALITGKILQSRYEKHADFAALVKKYGPEEKFRDNCLSKNIYGVLCLFPDMNISEGFYAIFLGSRSKTESFPAIYIG